MSWFRYGVDAPPFLAGYWIAAAADAAAAAALSRRRRPVLAALALADGACWAAMGAGYAYTTLRGKLVVWERELDALGLDGSERALDLGCGRGAVLIAVAGRLAGSGSAVGVDLWRRLDQSGNAKAAAQANAQTAGVADRVELVDADMRGLPFGDSEFDLVTASVAVHNIHQPGGRAQAIAQAYRVLKPGGKLLIADLPWSVPAYRDTLRQLGAADITVRSLGWRFSYGIPPFNVAMVTATKPR